MNLTNRIETSTMTTLPQVLPATGGAPVNPELVAEFESYGTRAVAIEPGGVDVVPLSQRHGRPSRLFWTWASPNLEFATVFVGFIGVAYFGLNFWQAALAVVVGNGLATIVHYVLSRMGPSFGLPQMVLSRLAFGFFGNMVPAGVGALIAGLGWFAVNSVSGALALSTLTGWNSRLSLVIIVVVQIAVAFLGFNLIEIFQRFALPVLGVVWVLAAIWIFKSAHFSIAGATGPGGTIGGFTLTTAACFGYAAGWNPYAADYTRYLPPTREASHRAALFAGAGLFLSTTFLEVVGVAAATTITSSTDNPVASFTGTLPTALANATLLCIALAACSANILNVYSAGLSFMAIGIRLPARHGRAYLAAGFGIIGGILSWTALSDGATKYQNFLLVVAYWLGPWLGIILADRLLFPARRLGSLNHAFVQDRRYSNWAGVIALLIGVGVSVVLFSNQTEYVGLVVRHHPAFGDITFAVGACLAALVYTALVTSVLPPGMRRVETVAASRDRFTAGS